MGKSVWEHASGLPTWRKGRGRICGLLYYAQLPGIVATFETWARSGCRLLFIFDEVHHASDNKWGSAADTCGLIATKVLAMTGTPFRGDWKRIAFVKYDADGKCIPSHKYCYKDAVLERVCRPVFFATDSGTADYVLREIEETHEA